MPHFGKPDHTGRSSGVLSGRARKLYSQIEKPFGMLPRALLRSDAWRLSGINCRRLIDFLLIEHMNHWGLENGRLMATYNQLVNYGLTRREISPAIAEGEFLGLINVEHGGRNRPSIFQLNFLPDNDGNAPHNRWKGIKAEDIRVWKRARGARRRNQKSVSESRTSVARIPEPTRRQIGRY